GKNNRMPAGYILSCLRPVQILTLKTDAILFANKFETSRVQAIVCQPFLFVTMRHSLSHTLLPNGLLCRAAIAISLLALCTSCEELESAGRATTSAPRPARSSF